MPRKLKHVLYRWSSSCGPSFFAIITVATLTISDQRVRAADLPRGPRISVERSFLGNAPALTPGLSAGTAASSAQTRDPFPHIATTAIPNSDGWSLVVDPDDPTNTHPGSGAPLDSPKLDLLSKFQLMELPATPALDRRPDIIPAIRARNPNIRIFGYVIIACAWCPTGGYGSDVGYYRDYFQTAMRWNTDGAPYSDCPTTGPAFLFTTDGNWAATSWINVNFAHRVQNADGSYTYDVAEAYADLLYRDYYLPHAFDGIQFDVMCMSANWVVKSMTGMDVDVVRAGYPDIPSFDDGWRQGMIAFSTRLRNLISANGDDDFQLYGNCGQCSDLYGPLNGWMRENFPHQNGGTWWANMFSPGIGYVVDDWKYRQPSINVLTDYVSPQVSATDRRVARFGLGSASLGNGYVFFGSEDQYQHLYWFDEYAVDLTTGRSSTLRENTGWLGQPKGSCYQMIWPNTNPDLIASEGFENESGTWVFDTYDTGAGSFECQRSGAPVGSAAGHYRITALDYENGLVSPGSVRIFSRAAITLSSNLEYALTFWAKADRQRTVQVAVGGDGGRAAVTVPITTSWQKYQAVLNPVYNSGSGTTQPQIYLGGELGEIWLDDIHVQQGVTNVYRRDFDHGIVLVNPYNWAQSVALERSYRKILGMVSPDVNDGAPVSTITVPWNDARFLLNGDLTPPSAITDLRVGP